MPQPNSLINETSPYLLQHAYNPVNWQPWGSRALSEAKRLDKPILVSIGYSACHWCHVMEHESFENEQVAALMNENFVCIKVDREERPDIDHIYMEALQAISGNGGWPLNMFLTPTAKPFYGGTYFPPVNAHGRPSWTQVLTGVKHAFASNRGGVEDEAEKLTSFLSNTDNNLIAASIIDLPAASILFTISDANKVFDELRRNFDTINGGFGGAPKFPNTLSLQYLLRHYHYFGNEYALQHAMLSLDKMLNGGIYDQIGGGFARYSTDAYWLAPHFEKMLYDNALLIIALCEAYQLTNQLRYKNTVIQTLGFIERELTSPEGGFYAALDADSEGIEGKYYVWQIGEIEQVLGIDATLFCEYYDVTPNGNWEGANILRATMPMADFAKQKGLDIDVLTDTLAILRNKLLYHREQRIRPGLDDKIILSWNAMMCCAYIKAYEVFGDEAYWASAEKNLAFILKKFTAKNGKLNHTYKNGIAKYPAFLDDYACLIEALLAAYEVTFNERYIEMAENYTASVINDFLDIDKAQFYYTPVYQNDIIVRKKELFDSVTPSGNSTMAKNLHQLAIITGNEQYSLLVNNMMAGILTSMINYASSFAKWGALILQYIYGSKEIAIVGPQFRQYGKSLRKVFLPERILMGNDGSDVTSVYPLLQQRSSKKDTLIYLCENYSCQVPYNDVNLFLEALALGA